MAWYVKRRPTKVSAFRDACLYLAEMRMLGTMWANKRKHAMPFHQLAGARAALRLIRSTEEKDAFIVWSFKKPPTPEQRYAHERLATGRQDTDGAGGRDVQIHQNLVKKGWAKFLDHAGEPTKARHHSVWTEITPRGLAALQRRKRTRRERYPRG